MITNFNRFKLNEENDFINFLIGFSIGPLILIGFLCGYAKIENLISFFRFKTAKNKLNFIINNPNIKNNEKLKKLLLDLYEVRHHLSRVEQNDDGTTYRKDAFKILHKVYDEIEKSISEKDFKKFKNAMDDFDYGSAGDVGKYLIDKNSKYKW